MKFLIAARLFLSASMACGAQGPAGGKPASVGVLSDFHGDVRWNPPRKGRPDLLDDLHPGDSLRVGAGASVALLYYADCRKEVVRGKNEVRIGRTASVVSEKAGLTKSEAPCEPPKTVEEEKTSSVPGALVLMGADTGQKAQEEAEKEYRDAINKNPEDVSAMLSYAAFCEGLARFEDAGNLYKEAMRLHPASGALKKRLTDLEAAETLSSLELRLGGGREESDVPERFRPFLLGRLSRAPEIEKLKKQNKLQEGPEGLLGAGQETTDADVRALLAAENKDRAALLATFSPPADPENLKRLYSAIINKKTP